MTTYAYKAKDMSGNTVSGTLDAETRSAAAEHVRRMGLVPLNCVETRSAVQVPSEGIVNLLLQRLVYPVWTGVSVKAQMLFFRQLATMLQAGMTLSAALGSVANQSGNGKLRRIGREAHEHVIAGGFLSEVLAKYPWIFSRVQMGLVRAGESSGGLDRMIDRIAAYLEQEMDTRRILRSSTLYPKLLIVAAFFLIGIQELVIGSPMNYLRMKLSLLMGVLVYIVPIYVLFKVMLQFTFFRAGYDTIKVSIPVLGAVGRKLAMSRFSRALALLYSAGMPMAQAVQVAADAVGNFLIQRAILSAVPAISSGVPASDAMRKTGQVPPMVLDMLSTGERTGNVDLTLNKVAEYYEKESESTVHTFGVVLFVVLVLIVAIVIGLQVISSYQGIFNKVIPQG